MRMYRLHIQDAESKEQVANEDLMEEEKIVEEEKEKEIKETGEEEEMEKNKEMERKEEEKMDGKEEEKIEEGISGTEEQESNSWDEILGKL